MSTRARLFTQVSKVLLSPRFENNSTRCADINPGNVMMGLADPKLLDEFEQAEIDDPTPRKEVDGRFIYLSRPVKMVPTAIASGLPILGDFGSAEWGEEQNKRDAQPDPFRSPEVLLKLPWSYEIDIWNIGCLVSE